MTGRVFWKILFVVDVFNVLEIPTTITSCNKHVKQFFIWSPSPPEPPPCTADQMKCEPDKECCTATFTCYRDRRGTNKYCRNVHHVLKDGKSCALRNENCGLAKQCCNSKDFCAYEGEYGHICRQFNYRDISNPSCQSFVYLCAYNSGCCEDSGMCADTTLFRSDPYCREPSLDDMKNKCDSRKRECEYNITCCGYYYKCRYITHSQRLRCEIRSWPY